MGFEINKKSLNIQIMYNGAADLVQISVLIRSPIKKTDITLFTFFPTTTRAEGGKPRLMLESQRKNRDFLMLY